MRELKDLTVVESRKLFRECLEAVGKVVRRWSVSAAGGVVILVGRDGAVSESGTNLPIDLAVEALAATTELMIAGVETTVTAKDPNAHQHN